MYKNIKTDLLDWVKHNYPTQYQMKYTKIKALIDQLPEDIKLKQGKSEIEKFLIK